MKETPTMALTKSHLIDTIAEQNGFTRKKSTETVEIILEIIKSTLASGENVLISGFGKFRVKEKRERKGRNPATGEDMIMAPRKVVTFRCSGKLRDMVNKEQLGAVD
jgi:integration host factor subunit alpha